nr:immunoglobulin light chain junction region [Macaca mulatta]MOX35386.1 immunoglobulin light chain junction region [Macaca mulatta]MOX35562.1 immunoglobulin light chain junction region [Macaca mulatta]MOX37573.1 immunoglobulin light chain junction region [Macaca mulatta]
DYYCYSTDSSTNHALF